MSGGSFLGASTFGKGQYESACEAFLVMPKPLAKPNQRRAFI